MFTGAVLLLSLKFTSRLHPEMELYIIRLPRRLKEAIVLREAKKCEFYINEQVF